MEIKLHEDLMKSHEKEMSRTCALLKSYRNEKIQQQDIPFIETMDGIFYGDNVLEGFRYNTELLCNENPEEIHQNSF